MASYDLSLLTQSLSLSRYHPRSLNHHFMTHPFFRCYCCRLHFHPEDARYPYHFENDERRRDCALRAAVNAGDCNVARSLLYEQADPNGLVESAAGGGRLSLVRCLLSFRAALVRDGYDALVAAMPQGTVVDVLLELGASVNARGATGGTVLHMAAARGDRALIQLLIARGADPSIVNVRCNRHALRGSEWLS